jgi:hypothetical protein
MALHLSQDVGLCHIEGWQYHGFMVADDPADYGIDPPLAQRIATWSAQYRQFQEGLYANWTPQHCRGFDIQRPNREGLAIPPAFASGPAMRAPMPICRKPIAGN